MKKSFVHEIIRPRTAQGRVCVLQRLVAAQTPGIARSQQLILRHLIV